MSTGSDTEPESLQYHENDGSSLRDIHQQLNFAFSDTTKPSYRDVINAVKSLENFDLAAVQDDEALQDEIRSASSSIIRFLHSLEAIGPSTPGAVHTFSILVHVKFLTTLFAYRAIFQRLATKDLGQHRTTPTIVSWVDVVLVKLGIVSVYFSCGFSRCEWHKSLPSQLRTRRDEDCLRAATQLPSMWEDLSQVVASEHHSLAARRLSLHLLFAGYVLGPQLLDYNPWEVCVGSNVNTLSPELLLERLYDRLRQGMFYENMQSLIVYHQGDQEKITFAMFFTLIAGIHQKVNNNAPNNIDLEFLPRSTSYLMECLQFIMNDEVSSSLSELLQTEVTPAQALLLSWEHAVPWCWSIWKDQRIEKGEFITYLTLKWLHHTNTRDSTVSIDDHWDVLENTDLRRSLLKHYENGHRALLQVLRFTVLSLRSTGVTTLDSVTIGFIHKLCWASVILLHNTIHHVETRLFCQLFLHLFVIVENTEDELAIKDLILEALSLCDPFIIEVGVKELITDKASRFFSELDEGISKAKSLLRGTGNNGIKDETIRVVNSILNFFCIMEQSKTEIDSCIHRNLAVSFLPFVTDHLAETPLNSFPTNCLIGSLLASLAFETRDKKTCVRTEEQVLCKLAVTRERKDLFTASSFAHYIATNEDLLTLDPLLQAEAWDYLRDVLLLILRHDFIGEDEPIALLACLSICRGVYELANVNLPCSQIIINSPWTITLISWLRDIIEDKSPSGNTFLGILQKQLASGGRVLLDQLDQITKGPQKRKHLMAGQSFFDRYY